MPRLRIGLLGAALAFPTASGLAQGVLVAPHAIVIDHRTRSSSLSLYNPSDVPAEVTLSTRSGTTRIVTRLEQAGWVRRVDCADDRRGTEAELTDAGLAKLAAAAPGHVAAVRAHMFDLLTPRQLAQMHAATTRMRDHLRRQLRPAGRPG